MIREWLSSLLTRKPMIKGWWWPAASRTSRGSAFPGVGGAARPLSGHLWAAKPDCLGTDLSAPELWRKWRKRPSIGSSFWAAVRALGWRVNPRSRSWKWPGRARDHDERDLSWPAPWSYELRPRRHNRRVLLVFRHHAADVWGRSASGTGSQRSWPFETHRWRSWRRPVIAVLECKGWGRLGDEDSAIIDVVVGSVACLFAVRWRRASPSEGGVINRVVQTFTLHFPQGWTWIGLERAFRIGRIGF